ncbi:MULTISPECIES: hypothetical protein [Pseudomonas syringae group]|uniref:hypothetical protein n=1 Tax=Pseudomonas syringae group TaxID=136849 RepID=UPI00020993D4|nr:MULTISPECIES: hypothetical protein [Pseudomonas syringae group]EGH98771.1 hypothetical protein PLA106_21978 [Pseudomonas amygdali pv. lachrymans str. M302278]KPY20794.1 hypothetical protein ALO89_200116 [Pseudomonas coronafaciens pv. porri]RMM11283.1 hypothetical protein ALQ85_102211 [Pseudomonas syringae]RMM77228.1 hypothetical protein ALQ71_200052 [Pseudomonas coronafaciens pv. striafaciens]RMP60383.1 hypothetical protein ALQ19_200058 [Pseudomonas syringae pv. berberidis]
MTDREPMKLKLKLTAAPTESNVRDPGYQQDLASVRTALLEAGILHSERRMMYDAPGVEGYAIGQYVIEAATIAGPIVGVAVGAWLKGRAGRKVRLKVGDIEVEAFTQAEVDALVDKALKLKTQLDKEDGGA